jgi:hypothetical protein
MKEMLTKTITVRVSAEVKAEFDQIRERVDAAGFDVGATMRDTISNTRLIRNELDAIDRKTCRLAASSRSCCSGVHESPRIILLWNGVWFSIPGAIRSMMSFEE